MKIKIKDIFSYTPGPRYKHEGPFSGELFRESKLAPVLKQVIDSQDKLIIDLDGTAGYGWSFIEETFGGLIRVEKIPYKKVLKAIEIISDDEPFWKPKFLTI